jgi:hypothetical protein
MEIGFAVVAASAGNGVTEQFTLPDTSTNPTQVKDGNPETMNETPVPTRKWTLVELVINAEKEYCLAETDITACPVKLNDIVVTVFFVKNIGVLPQYMVMPMAPKTCNSLFPPESCRSF